ncbi:OmpA family protein [Shewanella intestini]|uniref:OmpA family protein n=1 Tax=Shewanella intestini TaxID=2017544 RepID=A0ABS5I2Z4_9GAMM|nr:MULTISPECIES: OmpA family protein [Shewanella]MBR9728193.1 OmpA family protein [Shewanella intestini]MRG36665.1 OmpA family protein [Shewanella sp. XMDDZSB0408]
MKQLTLTIALSLAIGGCVHRDIVTMDTPTQQLFNLQDNDNDGVISARERCENTITGADIDNFGCATQNIIDERQELNILFGNNSDFIDPQYYGDIEKVASLMRRFPNTTVTIEGHCSRSGSYELNLALSQNRAKAVTEVLISEFNIAPQRLSAIGYSFDQPIADNSTAQGRSLNRRVIAAVSGDDTQTQMKWHIYTVDEEVD